MNSLPAKLAIPLDLVVENIDQDLSDIARTLGEINGELAWGHSLSDFQLKANTIRRILDRFYKADLPTRRYLRHHLDEEWDQLQSSYDTLRSQFTAAARPGCGLSSDGSCHGSGPARVGTEQV